MGLHKKSERYAAYSWLDKHYHNIPPRARPEHADLRTFSNLFSSYLACTFDLDAKPGLGLKFHCSCCFCSWMVQKPHLRPKKIGAADKKVAEKMKRTFLAQLAAARGISVSNKLLDDILQDPNLREPVGLCTYAADLLRRLKGNAVGAASLALWRSFAWTPQGSQKRTSS